MINRVGWSSGHQAHNLYHSGSTSFGIWLAYILQFTFLHFIWMHYLSLFSLYVLRTWNELLEWWLLSVSKLVSGFYHTHAHLLHFTLLLDNLCFFLRLLSALMTMWWMIYFQTYSKKSTLSAAVVGTVDLVVAVYICIIYI